MDLDQCCVYKSINIQVDFNSSKDELSTKKIRRKAEKAMKKEVDTLATHQQLLSCITHSLGYSNVVCYQITVQVKAKLYPNFVKSGTLTGGKMEEAQETDSGFVEDKVNLNWSLLFSFS